MDMILLGITIVSLVVALIMSVAAWRVTRDERRRAAARVAALSVAATAADAADDDRDGFVAESFPVAAPEARAEKPATRSRWAAPRIVASPIAAAAPAELPLNQLRSEPVR